MGNIKKLVFDSRTVFLGKGAVRLLPEKMHEKGLKHAFVCTDHSLVDTAVSYTHLDVYKRQAVRRLPDMISIALRAKASEISTLFSIAVLCVYASIAWQRASIPV